MRPLAFSIALALLVTPLAAPANAATLAGADFDDSVKVGGQTLVLNGLGLRKKLFVKVYVGGLYLAAKESDGEKILAGADPRRTVMHFLYKVSKAQLCEGWDEGLENNTPDASSAVAESFRQLCEMMEDVKPGERIVFTSIGPKTEVEVKGVSKGTIAGRDFSDALFACWLGPEPPSKDFQRGMLGG